MCAKLWCEQESTTRCWNVCTGESQKFYQGHIWFCGEMMWAYFLKVHLCRYVQRGFLCLPAYWVLQRWSIKQSSLVKNSNIRRKFEDLIQPRHFWPQAVVHLKRNSLIQYRFDVHSSLIGPLLITWPQLNLLFASCGFKIVYPIPITCLCHNKEA